MKSKETIQNKLEELKAKYSSIDARYQSYSINSDVSNALDSIEDQIEMLEWVLKEE